MNKPAPTRGRRTHTEESTQQNGGDLAGITVPELSQVYRKRIMERQAPDRGRLVHYQARPRSFINHLRILITAAINVDIACHGVYQYYCEYSNNGI